MAAVSKSGTPSPCTLLYGPEHQISGLIAGEAIVAGDACYIKGADGKVYKATGAAATEAAIVAGFAAKGYASGAGVTLLYGVDFYYGSGLTPGIPVYLSGTTAGGLVDAASTGGTTPIGTVVDATRVYLKKTY
jgi:hypothetical protein